MYKNFGEQLTLGVDWHILIWWASCWRYWWIYLLSRRFELLSKRLGTVGLTHYKAILFLSYGFSIHVWRKCIYFTQKCFLDGVYIFNNNIKKRNFTKLLYISWSNRCHSKTTIYEFTEDLSTNQLFVWDGESPHLTVSKAPSFHNKVRVIVHYSGNDSIDIVRNNEIKSSEIETFWDYFEIK